MEKSIKILVISNSEGNTGPILTAIDREHPDVIFHLGGGVGDLSDIIFSGKIYAVRSGSELGRKLPLATKIRFGKEIFLLSHCDNMSTRDRNRIAEFATTEGATIMLMGCEEEPIYFEQNDIRFVCPGSLYDRMTATYATIELNEAGDIDIQHHKLIEEN